MERRARGNVWTATRARVRACLGIVLVGALWAALPAQVAAQATCGVPGRDGPGGTLTGIVNTYYQGGATASAGSTTITLGPARGAATTITPGDLLLVIQMQDAFVSGANTASYGGANGTGRGSTQLNNTGRFEYVTALNSVGAGGGTLQLRGANGGGLLATYTNAAATASAGQRRFQVIRVPQYSTATFATGLTAAFWDGRTGGVLAVDVAGQLTLGGVVSVAGRGFRGGAGRGAPGGTGGTNTDFRNLSTNPFHGMKGEGIAGSPRFLLELSTGGALVDLGVEGYPNGAAARGAPGNAGGGGTDGNVGSNDQNSGGGGGGNGGTGGAGGNTWFSALAVGGVGGAAFTGSATQLVMGGGGGAGSRNNSTGLQSSGGAGGGIILVRAGTVTGSGTLNADGITGITPANDGGGGGGAGGSILLLAQTGSLAGATLQARGGAGTNADVGGSPHGPGGGGAGGVIVQSGGATTDVAGGLPGFTVSAGTLFGATAGAAGAGASGVVITATPGTLPSPACVPTLTVTKTTSTPTIVQTPTGTTATYTIDVSNAALRDTARSVVLSDLLPAGFTYLSSSAPVLTGGASRAPVGNPAVGATNPAWNTFAIPAGGRVQQQFVVTVPATITAGTFQNPATATALDPTSPTVGGTRATNYDPASSTGEDVTVAAPDLTIAKSHVGNFSAGTTGTYTLTVTNIGTAATTAPIVVLDTLPAGLTFNAASGATWSCGAVGQVVSCTRTAALAPTASAAITLVVNVLPSAVPAVTNRATVTEGGEPAANGGNNTASDPTTVLESADVAITKTGPTGVLIGTPFTFTLTATNNGPNAAANVVITDTLPANLIFVSATGGGTLAGNVVTWPTIALLPSGGTASVTITVRADVVGLYTNIAAATTTTNDAVPGNNRAVATTSVPPGADLAIVKAGPATALAGADLVYTLTVTDNGPSAAASVVVSDTIPAGLVFVSATGGGVESGGAVTWPTIASLPSGGTAAFSVTLRGVTGGAFDNVARVSSATQDAVPGNNRSVVTTTITPQADVQVGKTGPATAAAGSDVTYTVTVTNAGPSAAATVLVADDLPAGATFVGASAGGTLAGSTVTWPAIASLASGGSATFTVTVRYAAGGSYTNVARATSPTADPVPANNDGSAAASRVTTTVTAQADLRTTKSGPATADAGADLTYTIGVTNVGPSEAVGVVITDTIPAGTTFVAASNGGTLSGSVVTWPTLGTLAPGGSVAYTVTLRRTEPGTLTNIAAATSSTADPVPADNRAAAATVITGVADVTVTKTGPATAPVGGDIVYTLTVLNNGPSSAATVILRDTLPAGTTFVSASGGGTFAGGVVTWPVIGSLAPATPAVFTVTIRGTTAGAITNIARVTTTTADPEPGNDRSTATTTITPVADLVTLKSGPATATAGTPFTYTITTTNTGPSPATGVVVTDVLPAGLTFVSATGGGTAVGQVVTWPAIATLGVRAVNTVTVTVTAAQGGSYLNIASSTSTTPDPVPGNNDGSAPGARVTTTVAASADLVVTKTGPATAAAGSAITYTVSVVNNGPSTATNVVIRDSLPAGVAFTSASGGGTLTSRTVTWPAIAALAPAATASFTVTITAPGTGPITDIAFGTSDTPDPVPANNDGTLPAAQVTTAITPVADVVTTKTGPATATAGAPITYTLTVTNNGPSPAASVVVTDTLPAGLTFSTASAGGTAVGQVVTWPTIVSLAAGGSATFTVTATAAEAGSYTNIAASSSPTPDPVPANNNGSAPAARVTTVVTASADVSLAKTGPATAAAGTDVVFTLTATNAGPSTATGVVITDTIPAGVTFVSATGGGTLSGSVVTWPAVPTLAPGAGTSVTVTLRPTIDGAVTNIGGVTTTTADPVPGNNRATAPLTVTPSADVAVTKTGPATATAGADITYTVAFSNNGPSAAANVLVRDTLPAGSTFVSASGGGTFAAGVVTWPLISTLPAGSGGSFTVTLRQAEAGTLLNVAAATTTTPDAVTGNNRATASTVIGASADLQVTKTGPATATAGAPVTYTIAVTNAGPSTAAAVEVTDSLPAGATFGSASGGGTAVGRLVSWPLIATLAPGASQTFTVTLSAAEGGSYVNVARVTSPVGDPVPGNNRATATTAIAATADLAITKTGPATATAGADITYTLTAANNGPSTATAVVLTDTIPAGATFVTASNGGTLAGSVVTWPAIPSLAPAATVAYTVTLRRAEAGALLNVAAVTGAEPDAVPGNNRGTATTTVAASADLVTTKSGPATAALGTDVTYTITTTNVGPSTATDVVVRDDLPAGLSFVSASNGATAAGQTVTWPTVATLAPGASLTYTVTARTTATGALVNIASSTGTTPDPVPANNDGSAPASRVTTTVAALADVVTTKTGPATATAGADITYTLTVTNAGPSPATDVVVTDTLATGLTFVSATAGGTLAGTVVSWPAIPSLAAGASSTFSVTVRAAQGGSYTDIAASTSTTPDPTPGNNNGSAPGARVTTTVAASTDLAITKTGPATATAGTDITYTLAVTNNGPSTATGVVITDTLPAGATFVAASGGGTLAGTVVTWPTIGTLAPGGTASVTITLRAADGGTLLNVAAVTGAEADPVPANNRATATTTVNAAADLAVVKTGPATATAGANVAFTIAVTNNGPSAAVNVVVTDTVPTGATFVSASGGGTFASGIVTWPLIASLPAGGTASFTVTLRRTEPGDIVNIAAVRSATPDPVTGNNRATATTTIAGSADVQITKTGPATGAAGAALTYTLTVTNAGPSTATAVQVTDSLPVGTTFGSASAGGTAVGRLVTWPAIPTLAPGASQSFTVTLSAAEGGTIVNVANATTTTPDPTPANNRATATTTIAATVDLAITKTGPATAAAGADVTFSLAVVNIGPSTATGVVITDTIPAGATFVSASNGGTLAGSIVTWPAIPTLAATGTVTYTVTLRRVEGGALVNVAGVTGAEADANPGNNRSTATTAVNAAADVVTTKVGPATITAGAEITWTLTTVNNGPSTAAGVVVRDQLPAGAVFVSASNGGTAAGQLVTWPAVPTLAVGQTLTYTVTARAPGSGPLLNIASSTSTTPDPIPANNDGSAPGAQVTTTVNAQADLAVFKSGPARVDAGAAVAYRIVARNLGPSAAAAVTVTDQLPAGVTFVGASNGGTLSAGVVTWPAVASLAVNDSVVYTLTVTAPSAQTSLLNIVRATSTTPDPVPSNNDGSAPGSRVTTLVSPVDLAIAKAHVGDFGTGTQGTYTLTVSNVSTVPTIGPVTVTDSLPSGLTFASATGPGWSCGNAGQIVTCTTSSVIAPAQTSAITLRVNVLPTASGSLVNVATVSTPGDDTPGGNNIARDATRIVQINPLAIRKSASRTDAEIADVVDYTVEVRNLSTSDIPDVSLDDNLPRGFTYQRRTARIDQIPVADPTGAPGPNLRFAIGTLAGGQTVRVTYRVRIGPGANTGDGINRAVAFSPVTGARSAEAAALVRLQGGVFSDRGIIIGKVFANCDCDSNQVQGREDIGIPGVRVFLEDGTSTVTDVEGKYNFYGVTPRTHVLKVERLTLPLGGRLVEMANRNAGDAGSRFVDLTNGELHKADFVVAYSPEVLNAIKARRERGEITGQIIDTLAGTDWPRGVDDEPPPVGQDRPVAPVTPGADTSTANVFRPITQVATQTPIEEANHLPITRLPAIPVPPTVAPNGTIELVPAQRSVPADGNTAIAVRVRALGTDRKVLNGERRVTLEASLGRWLVEDLDPVEPGMQVTLQNGEGEFTLVASNQEGVGELRATSELLVSTVPVAFLPALRPLIANGVIEGRVDLRSLAKNGGIVPVTSGDRFERELRDIAVTGDSGRLTAGVRGALFLRGKVAGKTLLTLAIDTEREADRRFFRDIQPEEFYPVYGDASIKEFGAQSFDRVFVRIDRDRTFAMYGDYVTPGVATGAAIPRELGAYQRSLTGGITHVEGKQGQLDVFASRDRVTQVVEEIPGRGLSGPYQLGRTDGRLNTEKVEILTRDRNQPSRILKIVPLTRFTDYSLEPFTGRLLFFTPVPSVDENLNPVSIRVIYEVERAAGNEFWVYGAAGQLRVGDRAEVGGGIVRSDDSLQRTQLYSANASARLGEGTTVVAEVARTDGDSLGGRGNAGRIILRHSGRTLSVEAWGFQSDSGFTNPSSTFQRGRRELGARGSAVLNDRTRLLFEAIRSEDRIGGSARDGGLLAVERQVGKYLRAELGFRYAREDAAPASPLTAGATPNETQAARFRLTAQIPGQPRASVFGEVEQDIAETDQRRLAVGGEYVFFQRMRLYGRHEMLSSFAGPFALNDAQRSATTVIGLDAAYTKDGQFFSEYRGRDAFAGRETEAAIGLRNRWPLSRGVTAHTSFERVDVLRGTGLGEATAVTGALELTKNPRWRATLRAEYRFAPTGDNFLATLGYVRKLTRDLTLLGRGLLNTYGDGGRRLRNQVGLAWRETDRNRWNALARYEQRDERDGRLATDNRSHSHIVSAHLNWQPTAHVWLSSRYAGRWAVDSSLGLRSSTNAQLGSTRLLWDFARRWDAAAIGSVLWTDGFDNRQYGAGVEVGRILVTNLRVAAGYNVFGFRDPQITGADYTDRGPYVRFGFKFDEDLFRKRDAETQP